MIASCEGPDKAPIQGPSGEGRGGASLSSETDVPKTEAMYELEIVPQDAVRDTIFYAVPRNFNLADRKITWLINGHPVPDASGAQFKASEVKKGDVIQATVIGAAFKVLSNTVEIKNNPPEIKRIQIMPEVFKPGDTVYVEVTGADVDGDAISFSYEWTINGKIIGTDERIGVQLKKADKINIKVTPFDGVDHGKPVVLEEEILNMAPMIVEHNEFTFDGKVYSYQVKATDPDGDALTYTSASVLNGMTLDPATGLLRWDVPSEFKGKQDVSITVSDGHGGTATYSITITIQ